MLLELPSSGKLKNVSGPLRSEAPQQIGFSHGKAEAFETEARYERLVCRKIGAKVSQNAFNLIKTESSAREDDRKITASFQVVDCLREQKLRQHQLFQKQRPLHELVSSSTFTATKRGPFAGNES